MSATTDISDEEFALFQRLIYKIAGISLSDVKKVLLVGRLTRRLKANNLDTFGQYYRMLATGNYPEELQIMVTCSPPTKPTSSGSPSISTICATIS